MSSATSDRFPACHLGAWHARVDLGDVDEDLQVAVLHENLLELVLEDLALDTRDVADLLLEVVQQSHGVDEGEARFLEASDGRGDEGEVALDEGEVLPDAAPTHEILRLLDAPCFLRVKLVHHVLDLLQVSGVEECCHEPSASTGQHWLGWHLQLGAALSVGGAAGRCLHEDTLAGGDELVHLRKGLQCLLSHQGDGVKNARHVQHLRLQSGW